MKRFLFTFAVAAMAMLTASCSKGNDTASRLVGTWKQTGVEYMFLSHSLEMENTDAVTFEFRSDGTCTVVKDGKSREDRFVVDNNVLYVGTDDVYIVSLTNEELVLSAGYDKKHMYGGSDRFKKFTMFKGVQIYLDEYDEYCYPKGEEWFNCERLDEGAHGDPAGAVFYDCTHEYFAKQK